MKNKIRPTCLQGNFRQFSENLEAERVKGVFSDWDGWTGEQREEHS